MHLAVDEKNKRSIPENNARVTAKCIKCLPQERELRSVTSLKYVDNSDWVIVCQTNCYYEKKNVKQMFN